MPLSAFLTRKTSRACASIVMFLCTKPRPPARAMVIARSDSVTVSMAALTSGMRKDNWRVRRVWVSTSAGRTSDSAGSNRTSSKVSDSPTMRALGFSRISALRIGLRAAEDSRSRGKVTATPTGWALARRSPVVRT